ncbi:secreted RxLR effector protein 161-like [Humulus lupulus]|uniref:secreted RxLR effector protein 161-like n=1 Tax=Humulus lupulus TaxID=3486 RepID=UPI002B417B96|nr:secreted RxLR effector protein 161-like [Humulus lupulus]
MLEKFGFTQVKHARTPIGTTSKLNKDESGDPVDPTLYRSMIGSLLYLTASRPDISFSVGLCARYQANPKQSHLTAVKRIFKYLAETIEFGLWYSCDTNMSLVGYSDSDWAGSLDDRKSTYGGCFYIGNNLVSWFSKKQHSISLSTCEAEYIAAGTCCTQLIWLNKMLTDYGHP